MGNGSYLWGKSVPLGQLTNLGASLASGTFKLSFGATLTRLQAEPLLVTTVPRERHYDYLQFTDEERGLLAQFDTTSESQNQGLTPPSWIRPLSRS